MASPWVILVAAILTNNILLVHFLGMCPFLAISRNMKAAIGMGSAVVFVTTVTAMLNHLIYYGVLVKDAPLCAADLTHLTFIVFVLVIAGFTQLVEIVIERVSPTLYYALGVFLPLIAVNCAILGASFFMVIREYSFAQAAAFGLGTGVGWSLVIVAMAGIRERLKTADVPAPLRGLGISLMVAGLMAMAFMGFTGMVNIH